MSRRQLPTAEEITGAAARWIAEARRFPPREAARLLRRKARFVEEQIARCRGDAWALNAAHGDLLAAANRLTSPA